MAERPDIIDSQRVDLKDGRRVQVIAYSDHSIRFRVSDPPYLLEEAYIQGNSDHAIVKLVPKTPSQPVDPDRLKHGRRWDRAEFENSSRAWAFAREAINSGRRLEGPVPPKAEGDPWVVWTRPGED
jgi:hypothetical protein